LEFRFNCTLQRRGTGLPRSAQLDQLGFTDEKNIQYSAEPVSGDIDRCGSIVDICQVAGWVTSTSEDGGVPGKTLSNVSTHLSILGWSNNLPNGTAVKNDVKESNQVHDGEHGRHAVKTPDVLSPG